MSRQRLSAWQIWNFFPDKIQVTTRQGWELEGVEGVVKDRVDP